MKVAMISPFQLTTARGIERFTESLAGALSRRGVTVDVLTWGVRAGGAPPAPPARVRRVPYFRYYRDWVAIPYYAAWMAAEQYDWVLVYFAGYGEAPALRLVRMFRAQRYCVVFHFPRELVPHRYAEFARSGLARRADRLVAVSPLVAVGAETTFGRTCAVIGNGVDPAVFCPDPTLRARARAALGVGATVPVLISLAALEERKGVQWVIRALPYLRAAFPDLQYWVLGEGAYRGALEAEIAALGLHAQVRLLGQAGDVVPFLAAADVGCFLAYGEAFGIAVLEYLAMGLPVVISRDPPLAALVQPAWGAALDAQDSPALARYLGDLLRHPARRVAMGEAGRAQVLAHHTWDQVAAAYLALLGGPGS